jgi:hypothetical protein
MARLSVLLCLGLVAGACNSSWPPRDVAERNRAIAEKFDRDTKAEMAAEETKADADFKKRIADPGSITVEQSDLLIAQLQSGDPQARAQAAAELANAKGARGVAPIVTALRAERNEATFVVCIKALDHFNDVRAVDGLIDAMNQPGMSDQAREDALRTIYKYRAEWRLAPEIRKFYDSLTDSEVKRRVEWLVQRLGKWAQGPRPRAQVENAARRALTWAFGHWPWAILMGPGPSPAYPPALSSDASVRPMGLHGPNYIPMSIALHIPFEQAYPAIAWLCWVPNLVVAQFLLRSLSSNR